MVYLWSDQAGRSWTLTENKKSPDKLDVGNECQFYKDNYTVAKLIYDEEYNVVAI